MKTATKALKRSLNGILLLDKPLGMSSNKALKKVQHLFSAKKAGHTGSLDPLATGMLPICFGEATKLSQYLLEADKTYCVTTVLGKRTNTGDAEGEILLERAVPILTKEILEGILQSFRGKIIQTPPIYSALKFQGKPLYEYARAGQEVAIKKRQVHIYELNLLGFTQHSLQLEVHCSKGTYIRSLVDDIGEALGCGAYVNELRRTQAADYHQQQMISLESLEQAFDPLNPAALDHYLLPLNQALSDWPIVKLTESEVLYFQRGQSIAIESSLRHAWVKVCDLEGNLLGLGEVLDSIKLAPKRVFNGMT